MNVIYGDRENNQIKKKIAGYRLNRTSNYNLLFDFDKYLIRNVQRK